jgi:hypothetical protein
LARTTTATQIGVSKGFEFGVFKRLYFKAATVSFQARRVLGNAFHREELLPLGRREDYPYLLSESKSPIFGDRPEERTFEDGKLVNLQIAGQQLQDRLIRAGMEFSFWRQLGRPTPGKGYRIGREIRWGCMVPSVGGGLCQLSGALFECAARIGATMTEVHSHSRRISQDYYRPERDATIFWNYVDLRFRPKEDIFIEVDTTQDNFILRFWGASPAVAAPMAPPLETSNSPVEDCLYCGKETCHFHPKTLALVTSGMPIFSPAADNLTPFQNWRIRFLSFIGRFTNKILNFMGLPVGAVSIYRGRILSAMVRNLFPFQRTFAIVSQITAPYLSPWLTARGAPYHLKLLHLPLGPLQERLDCLARIHPQDRRVADFRVSLALIEASRVSIQKAQSLETDHPFLKELFPEAGYEAFQATPAVRPRARQARSVILFPGPCEIREGLAEVLWVANKLGLKVICPHPSAKGQVAVRQLNVADIEWDSILAYVHPCVFDRPSALLNDAIAEGLPIVGTRGIPFRGKAFVECQLGDGLDLEKKLLRTIAMEEC